MATKFRSVAPEWLEGRSDREEQGIPLALVKTTFARFPFETCEALIYRGWWLAGASISTFHRELLPEKLPSWRSIRAPSTQRGLLNHKGANHDG
jgi:NTE family protein